MVNMPPCHGGDRGFESHLDRHSVCKKHLQDIGEYDTISNVDLDGPVV